MTIAGLYQRAKEKSTLAGVIITYLIAFISFVIFPSGIIYSGDIQMIIGCIIGTRFTLRNNHSHRHYITYGIFVGLIGASLTCISYTTLVFIVLLESFFNSFAILVIFELYFIEAIIVGLTVGLIIGGYYNHKYKSITKTSIEDDPFYQSLYEK